MPDAKPFVQAACICENVLFDKDNVASVIRIVDTFKAEVPDNLPAGMPFGFPITVFVRLAFGEAKATGNISIQPRRPDGTLGTRQNVPIPEGNFQNAQFKSGFHILSPQQGMYWFDIYWNDNFLTSIPATVTVTQLQVPGASRQA